MKINPLNAITIPVLTLVIYIAILLTAGVDILTSTLAGAALAILTLLTLGLLDARRSAR